MNQAETIAFLTRLAGTPPVETHISYVFLGRDTVWKLKKAVLLPFLDFRAITDRHRFCLREVALNAPHAEGLYRDVAPVTRGADGALTLGGSGEVVDWVVRMARVPDGDFLDVRAARGGLDVAMLDRVADTVAAFHLTLPPVTGAGPDMAGIAAGNLTSALSAGLPEAAARAWHDRMMPGLAALAPWVAHRAKDGFVRRCHGDLHLGNLCLWRGAPVPFDALEFDEALAEIDTGYDLAFLLMDLEHRIDSAAANRVMNRYVARTGDADLTRGLPVFLSMRAMVRAHVAARTGRAMVRAHVAARTGRAMVRAHVAARTGGAFAGYLAAAADYLAPVPGVVIAIGGLQGTGKSSLARALAPGLGRAPGALVARGDEIRKRQNGVAPEQRLPPSAYTSSQGAAVFAELAAMVETAARGGHAVIADAMFMDPAHRRAVEAAARRAGMNFVGLWLTAPAAVLERRVAARIGDASDATVAVLRAAAPRDPGAGTWRALDASASIADLVAEVMTIDSVDLAKRRSLNVPGETSGPDL